MAMITSGTRPNHSHANVQYNRHSYSCDIAEMKRYLIQLDNTLFENSEVYTHCKTVEWNIQWHIYMYVKYFKGRGYSIVGENRKADA